MWRIILVFLFVVQVNSAKSECGMKNILCVNETSFYFCRNVGEKVVTFGKLTHCNDGYGCHESIGFYPCEKKENLPVITTTTPKPTCSIEANHNKKMPLYKDNIQDCSQYLTCENNLLLFWDLKEKSCPKGTGFSNSQSDCVRWIDPKTCEEIEVPTTTTTRPIPNCDAQKNEVFEYYDGNVKNCAKYYECVRNVVWWDLKTRNCPIGTGFSIESKSCVADISPETCQKLPEISIGKQRCEKLQHFVYYDQIGPRCGIFYRCGKEIAIIVTKCSEHTTPKPPECGEHVSQDLCEEMWLSIFVPVCVRDQHLAYFDENGLNMSKYFECVYKSRSWKPEHKQCPEDTVFELGTLKCVEKSNNVITTVIKTMPKCTKNERFLYYGAANFPSCIRYYECREHFGKWDLSIEECEEGKGFSAETMTCDETISPETCQQSIEKSLDTSLNCTVNEEFDESSKIIQVGRGSPTFQSNYIALKQNGTLKAPKRKSGEKMDLLPMRLLCVEDPEVIEHTKCQQISPDDATYPKCKKRGKLVFFDEEGNSNFKKYYECQLMSGNWVLFVRQCKEGKLFSWETSTCETYEEEQESIEKVPVEKEVEKEQKEEDKQEDKNEEDETIIDHIVNAVLGEEEKGEEREEEKNKDEEVNRDDVSGSGIVGEEEREEKNEVEEIINVVNGIHGQEEKLEEINEDKDIIDDHVVSEILEEEEKEEQREEERQEDKNEKDETIIDHIVNAILGEEEKGEEREEEKNKDEEVNRDDVTGSGIVGEEEREEKEEQREEERREEKNEEDETIIDHIVNAIFGDQVVTEILEEEGKSEEKIEEDHVVSGILEEAEREEKEEEKYEKEVEQIAHAGPECSKEGTLSYPGDCRQYYECREQFGKLHLFLEECPDGKGFSIQTLRCEENISPKTCQKIIPPIPQPECTKNRQKFVYYDEENNPSCKKYYECRKKNRKLELTIRECNKFKGFSATTLRCERNILPTICLRIAVKTSTPTESTTERVTPKPTAPPTPNCDDQKEAFYPYYDKDTNQINCKYFYKCESGFIWWNLNKKTCPSGTGFSDTTLQCESGISPETCLPVAVPAANSDIKV